MHKNYNKNIKTGSSSKEFIKDSFKYFPALIFPGLIGFVSIPIITRLFLPGDYGNYSIILALIELTAILFGWVSLSVIRFYPAFRKNGSIEVFKTIVTRLFIFSITSGSIIFTILSFTLNDLIPPDLRNFIYISLIIIIGNSIFDLSLQFLRTKRMAGTYSLFEISRKTLNILIGLILVIFLNTGIEGLLYGIVLSLVILLPLVWIKSINKVNLFHTGQHFNDIREIISFSFPLMFAKIASWILTLSDRFMLKLLRNSSEVGIYSASYRIAEYSILIIVLLFMFSSNPITFNIWEKHGEEQSKTFVEKITRYFLILCIPLVLFLSINSKNLMLILTSDEYIAGYKIIPFVMAAIFFLGLQQRYYIGLMLYKKSILITLSIFSAAIINVGLNFLFIPEFGYFAASISTLVSYFFSFIFVMTVSLRYYKWHFPFRTLILSAAFSAATSVILFFLSKVLIKTGPLASFTISIFSGFLIYFLALFLMGELKKEEILRLVFIFKKKI